MRREQWQLRPVMPVGGGNRAGRAARCRAEPTPRSLPPCARAGGSAGSEAQALTDDCQFGLTVGAPPRLRERVALRLDNAVLFCWAPGGDGGETLRQISINSARWILGQNRQALVRNAPLFEAQQEEPRLFETLLQLTGWE
jgi:hypothetical protein